MTQQPAMWKFARFSLRSSLLVGLVCGVLSHPPAAWAMVDFDGADDYISVNANAQLASNPISVAIWAKSDVAPSQFDAIIGKTNGAVWSQGYGLFFNSSTVAHFFIQGYATNVAVTTVSTPTDWNHYVGVWDGTTITLYVNGVAGTTDTYTGSMTTTNPLDLARLGSDLYNWNGQMTDFRIYQVALTAAQVMALYAARMHSEGLAVRPFERWPLHDCPDGTSGDGVTFRPHHASGNYNGTGIDGANNTGLTCLGESQLSYP